MAETSRNRVTITLGRSGQVVNRPGSASDFSFNDAMPAAGKKRSVRDRLGGNAENSMLHGSLFNDSSKRHRRDTGMSTLGPNSLDDVRIGKNDLRLKLMQKNASRRAHSDDYQKLGDLREKLSKAVRPSVPSIDSRQRLPELKDTGVLGRIPPPRSADNMPHVDSFRSSYSSWTLDHLRRRSPDRVLGSSRGLSPQRSSRVLSPQRSSRGLSPQRSSRGLSPQRNVEELQRRPLNRAFNDVRPIPYMTKNLIDTRPMSGVNFVSNSTLPPGPVKPMVPPLHQLHPPSGIIPKSSFMVEEQQTVDGLLHALGLGKYSIIFKAEEVDMAALKQMGENDLKELGVPMGPRKKILLALAPRTRRQP